ncbi:MAG: hypothetical protein JSV24_11130 [Bacteroidales bacterium]|nr:MAG: hypothetical protein JSV24_11130 [Bacteroidales bacterium]
MGKKKCKEKKELVSVKPGMKPIYSCTKCNELAGKEKHVCEPRKIKNKERNKM